MSTVTVDAEMPVVRVRARAEGADGAAGRVTFPRVVRSEWVKFRSLRSSWALLASAAAGMMAIGAVIGYTTGKNFAGLDAEDSAASGALQGFRLATLLMGVLGVLLVTGEYGTGSIRSTLAAVPRRLPVLGPRPRSWASSPWSRWFRPRSRPMAWHRHSCPTTATARRSAHRACCGPSSAPVST